MGIQGPIPANTISRLSGLQILSLRSNQISGEFPSDFPNLKNLCSLYLEFNNFSGPLLVNFSIWKNLTVVNLSNNRFNGSIPSSLSNLSNLQSLNLANNSFSGEIPDLKNPNLDHINLSRNNLTGRIPIPLRTFPFSVFDGNNIVPERFPSVFEPEPEPLKPRKDRKLSDTALLGIIVSGCVLGIVAFAVLMIVYCLRRTREDVFSGKLQKGEMSTEKVVSWSQDVNNNNKLFFFEGCTYTFDLEDLLRASAEVLGKGTFGIAYKAVLEDATTVVVKRLKEVGAGKRDFEQQMEVVGDIRHENVVELKAYFYSKDEKLMVYDYYNQGSLSTMLHGKKGGERVTLDWNTRMKIAIGAARGIARIHMENGGKFVHGNIKSSNIFLNSKHYGCVADAGLAAVMSPLPSPISRAAGYRAPEVTDTRKATQTSDVYSFGVVLLELLTGKGPIHTTGDEIVHLVRWVHSVVREEWTAEVFDVELLRYPNIEEEMVEMLQIALSCVTRGADQRPKMVDLVKMLENVRVMDAVNQVSSGNRSGSSTPPPGPPAAAA